MESREPTQFKQSLHSARNSLNSIVLHAELGKMLMENNGDAEQIKNAFTVILQQCKGCEKILTKIEKNRPDKNGI